MKAVSAINQPRKSDRPSQSLFYFRSDCLRIVVLFAVSFIVHLPALPGEFIWDDGYLARDNPLIKSPLLLLETFRHHLFLDSFSTHYRPIQNISYIFDYYFWNRNSFGFHLTNVALHASSGILLYFLARYLFSSLLFRRASCALRFQAMKRFRWISLSAFGVAILWVVHPVHSAAVDYISGRADSLAFLFACAGWLLFIRARRSVKGRLASVCYASAAVCGLLTLLSREIGAIWLLLFVLHLVLVERQKTIDHRVRLCAIGCCLAIGAAYLALRLLAAESATATVQDNWSAPVRIILMARALGDYARLLIFPANLHMERTVFVDAGNDSNADWRQTIGAEYLSIIGLLFLALLIHASIKGGPGRALRIFGAGWFVVGYLPISNLVTLNATVAEHWLYLPSVGFLIILVGYAIEMSSGFRKGIVLCALVAVLALGCRSFVRSSDWADEVTFYQRTLRSGGTSARVAGNLARIYAEHRQYAAAETMLRRVVAAAPDYSIAINNLADLLFHNGKTAEAEAMFRQAAEVAADRKRYPRPWIGAVNFAILRHKAKDDKQALATLAKERAAHPNVWDIVSYESEMLRQTKGPDAALPLLQKFTRDNWWHHGASLALGRVYAQKGNVDLAIRTLRQASRLDVHDSQALSLIATINMEQNHLEDACRIQRRAIARQPDEPRQYILLSNILEKMGRDEEARAALAHVSHLRELAHTDTTLLN